MLDRESACNRVFLACRFVLFGADGVGLRFKPVFNLAAAQRSTMSSPLPYYRTDQTSSDVGMIGMITASARRRCMDRRRNGTNVSEKRRRPVLVLKRCPLVPRSWTSISTLSMLLQQGETIGG